MAKIFFDHFPKTAGTSLYYFFLDAFGEEQLSPALKDISLERALALYGEKKVLIGHFLLHPDKPLPAGYVSATVLRNPQERTLSEYYFTSHDTPDAMLDPVGRLIKKKTIESALVDPDTSYKFFNPQATHYANLLHPTPRALCEDELLVVAKNALDLYDLVGTTESITQFIDKIRDLFSINNLVSIKRHKITSHRKNFTELSIETQQCITTLTRVDQALWKYAHYLFEMKTQRLTADKINQKPLIGQIQSDGYSSTSAYSEKVFVPVSLSKRVVRGVIDSVFVVLESQLDLPGFFLAGELVKLRVQFRAIEDIENLTIGYCLKHDSGLYLFGFNSYLYGYQLKCKADGEYHVSFTFPLLVGVGRYNVDITMHSGRDTFSSCYFQQEKCVTFEVGGYLGPFFEGVVRLLPALTFSNIEGKGEIKPIDVRTSEQLFSRLSLITPEVFNANGSLAVLFEVSSVTIRELFSLGVEVHNRSQQLWYGEGNHPVQLSYHWLNESREAIIYDGKRSPLPGGTILPAQIIRADVVIEAPDCSGKHLLVISLVQEGVAWLEDRGFQPAIIHIDVLPNPLES